MSLLDKFKNTFLYSDKLTLTFDEFKNWVGRVYKKLNKNEKNIIH